MYMVTKDNVVCVLIKNNALEQTVEVSQAYLSKEWEVVSDSNNTFIINSSDIVFSTTNLNLIKNSLIELKEVDFCLNEQDQEFNNEVLDNEYSNDISDDPDYYIHLN